MVHRYSPGRKLASLLFQLRRTHKHSATGSQVENPVCAFRDVFWIYGLRTKDDCGGRRSGALERFGTRDGKGESW